MDPGDVGYRKSLKSRHINMIAIGAELFLGAGGRLAHAGPALDLHLGAKQGIYDHPCLSRPARAATARSRFSVATDVLVRT